MSLFFLSALAALTQPDALTLTFFLYAGRKLIVTLAQYGTQRGEAGSEQSDGLFAY
jgi:hypothetical protein